MRKSTLVKLAVFIMASITLSGCICPYGWDGGYYGGGRHDRGGYDGGRYDRGPYGGHRDDGYRH